MKQFWWLPNFLLVLTLATAGAGYGSSGPNMAVVGNGINAGSPATGTLAEMAAVAQGTSGAATNGNGESQSNEATGQAGSSSATSYVYQAGNGYAVAADGSMSTIPGSPFAINGGTPVVGGNYLFAFGENTNITSYSISSNGALKYAANLNIPPNSFGWNLDFLDVDRTGQTLYAFFSENGSYRAFSVQPTGALSYLDYVPADESGSSLSFTSNDVYAYESDCYHGSQSMYGYRRASSGALMVSWQGFPSASTFSGDCSYGAAVSGNNYVVSAVGPTDMGSPTGQYHLVVYAIDRTDGSLSLSSTNANMPVVNVGASYIGEYRFDPTGTYLAFAEPSDVKVFRFKNGVLSETGTYPINQGVNKLAWDGFGHLFVTAGQYGQAGYLYVFNVHHDGVPKLAPGSPIATTSSYGLAVKILRQRRSD